MSWLDDVRKRLQGDDGPVAKPGAPARPDLAEFFGTAGARAVSPISPVRVSESQPAPLAGPTSAATDVKPPEGADGPAASSDAPGHPVDSILGILAREDDTISVHVDTLGEDEAPTTSVDASDVEDHDVEDHDAAQFDGAHVDVVQPIAVASTPQAQAHTIPDDSRIDIEVRWDVRSAPAAQGSVVHALVSLTPHGTPLVGNDGGAVLHLILALDLSASMRRPDKYPVLKKALATLLSQLHEDGAGDIHLSVIAFGRGAEYVLRDVRASTLTADVLQSAVEGAKVRFTNYTDVAGALERAFRVARRAHQDDPRMPIRVMVLTDGRPQDIPSAQTAMAHLRSQPADVDCLCFGEDADVDTMKKLIAGGRGGTVKHVDPQSLGDAFGRIAEVAKRVIAKRTLVDVDLREDVLGGGAWRFRPGRHDFGPRAFEEGRHFAVDLGTVEAGRAYSIAIRLRVPPTKTVETEAGRVTVRIPGVGGPRVFEAALVLPRHPGDAPGESDRVVRQALEILDAGVAADPQVQLRSLRARRALHQQERRDARSLAVIDRAIALLESGRTLDDLTPAEHAVLSAHTRTVHARRQPARNSS